MHEAGLFCFSAPLATVLYDFPIFDLDLYPMFVRRVELFDPGDSL